MRLVDTHAHLVAGYFPPAEREAALARARAAGVVAVLNAGTTLADSEQAAALATADPLLWAAAGVHPHEAKDAGEATYEALAGLLRAPRVVAAGECGLDYHYNHSPRPVQRQVLARQIRLAREASKPLVLHNRESDQDLLALLDGEGAAEVGGVIHAFSAGPEVARRCLDLGFHLGFGGMITFKTADAVREALRMTPLDRLLFETDAPYLTPVPHRGKRNEPAHVALVAARAAAELGVPAEELGRRTSANAARLFGIDLSPE